MGDSDVLRVGSGAARGLVSLLPEIEMGFNRCLFRVKLGSVEPVAESPFIPRKWTSTRPKVAPVPAVSAGYFDTLVPTGSITLGRAELEVPFGP